MARYTGAKTKVARKFGEQIFGPDKAVERRPFGPGQHGPNKRRGAKRSEFAIQLNEKQKAKYTYGLLERQFLNMYKKANAKPGITGEILLQLCESRLDNVVFRLGIAPTRSAARQLVSHKHITINGNVVNIPSYSLRIGEVVGVREKSKSLEAISNSLASNNRKYDWLDWNSSSMEGKFLSIPARDMIPENIKEQLIVELYSK